MDCIFCKIAAGEIPSNFVHKDDDGKSYVTVIQNGQRTEREVTLGLKNDTYAEVRSGLEAGEVIVSK